MKIKRYTAVLLSVCLMLLIPQLGAAANEPQGEGTYASPYLIQTRAELIDLASRRYDRDLSKYYILAADINLSGIRWTPIGDETIPFKGVFDGNGCRITGLSIPADNSAFTGFFGYNSGVIRKLMVDGAVSGNENTGILAGFNTGEISQCRVSGSVSGTGYSVGALVGQSSGYISECAAGNAEVESVNAYAGGLIGLISAGRAENCLSVANVRTSGRSLIAGGLIGVLSGGAVRYSFAAGRVSPNSANVNGLIGRIDPGAAAEACYFDVDAAGCNDASAIALSTDQAKWAPSYGGWNFTGVWDIYRNVNYGYPYLRNTPFLFETIPMEKAALPVATPTAGNVAYGTKVTLSSSTSGSDVYYTTDGSTPSISDTKYTQPITITDDVTIKAVAAAPEYDNSDFIELAYRVASGPKTAPPASNAPPGFNMAITLQIGNREYTKNNETAFFDVAPYIEPSSNRTMVPIRFIAEALGATVYWDDATRTDYITLYDRTLIIELNRQLSDNMGSSMLINGRLFVPIRYVSEQLGANVDWDSAGRTVIITK